MLKDGDEAVLRDFMEQKRITKYRLSKNSGLPYTTVNDICEGRAQIEKCSAETIYKLAKALDVSMEALIEPYVNRPSFELFKSNVCHKLKELGDLGFIADVLSSGNIRNYYELSWFTESLYLLAMVDYISRVNDVPLCNDYDDLRHCSLTDTVYPASVLAAATVSNNAQIIEQARKESIPEFIRFNIVESEVRDIV